MYGTSRSLTLRKDVPLEPNDDRVTRRHPAVRAVRRLLLVPVDADGTRIIDVAVILVGILVALCICLPILVVAVLVGIGVGVLLAEVGAPDAIRTAVGLGVVGLGLVLSFAVLVRLYRRLPTALRNLVADEERDDRA
jgi:hypothetical protein